MDEGTIKEYDGYLFDADGTLFDTTDLIVRCFQNTARLFGLPFPGRELIVSHIGLTLRDQMETYFGKLPDELYAKYRDAHMAYQLEIYRDHLRLFPGVANALGCLRERGKRCAVVTSRLLYTLTIYLEETNILRCFDVLITPECTQRHKPDPQPALEALRRLGTEAGRSLFIGDASYDIECGAAAGTDTAFVTWSHNPAGSLRKRPTYIFSDMADLCVW